MTLYYIHLCGASDGANDPDGEEFASDAAARDHVIAAIGEMEADRVSASMKSVTFVFEVRRQDQQLVARIPFALGSMVGVPPAMPRPLLVGADCLPT